MNLISSSLVIVMSVFSINAFANGSAHHSGQASKHSAIAASQGLTSTAKVASAVMAAPVVAAAGVSLVGGSVVSEVGGAILDSAKASHANSHHHHQTLVVTELTITADPAPNQVINR